MSSTVNSAGAIDTLVYGNGLVETRFWNDRLQLTGINAATGGAGSVLTLGFHHCAGQQTSCASGNDGNVKSQTIALPGLNLTQSYTYDALNQLKTAGEGTGSWSQTYGYDNRGNRSVSANEVFPQSPNTPTVSSNFDERNRLHVNGAAYDSSGIGTQTAIGGHLYTFDAENRLVQAAEGTSVAISSTAYVYDGEGQRVRKITCPAATRPCTDSSPDAVWTDYVYDATGNLAAEYPSNGSVAGSSGCGTATCYLLADHLGSTRLMTDATGNVKQRYDYLPFGEGIPASIGSRTTEMGYLTSPDAVAYVRQLFTGQYRDLESALDYFNARYYSPQQGRFVSPDPQNAGASPDNPQTWNAYAYVGNNPLNITDPSGLGFGDFMQGLIHRFLSAASFGIWEGITAALEGRDPIPHSGGLPNVSNFFSCGGPLGNCGGINNPPWRERLPIGSRVQDPERFLMHANQLAIRANGQGFGACMEQYAGNYSMAGLVDLALDTHFNDTFVGSTLGGNNVTGTYFLFFGTTPQSSANGFTTVVNQTTLGNPLIKSSGIAGGIGANLTAGRRTASIMSLNLQGATGSAPQVLARSAALRRGLSVASKVGTGLILVDIGLTLGQAINCSMTR